MELPPTHYEIEQQRHNKVLEDNRIRERIMIFRRLAARNIDEPKIGDVMHVRLDRSVSSLGRNRAGVRFERDAKTTVVVVDATDDEIALARGGQPSTNDTILKAKVGGHWYVNTFGAAQILEDMALHVNSVANEVEAAELRDENARLASELAIAREQIAAAERASRRAAPESADGRPTRIPAAAKARTTAEAELGAHRAKTPTAGEVSSDFDAGGEPAK